MVVSNQKDVNKAKRTLAWYNMIPNLIWSVLNITPVAVYWFNTSGHTMLYIFLAISVLPAFFRNAVLDKLQAGKTVKIYKQLGVHLVNRVAQNGVIINKLVKRKFPDHKIVTNKRSSVTRLIRQTYVFEKFHLILFLFFSLTTGYACSKSEWGWACIILITNIAYNVYPNLLQQYIRLKLQYFNHSTGSKPIK